MILIRALASAVVLGWLAAYMVDKAKKREEEKAWIAFIFDNLLNIGWYCAIVWLIWT